MEIVTKIAPIALAFIMLGLGLGLTGQDFIRVIKQPRDFLVGFLCQLILLPVIAFVVIKIFNTPSELAIGLMIIAAAPGGVTSNILTKFADGDVALSISLTAIVSLISIISVPFIIFKSADLLQFSEFSKEISMITISLKMFFVVTLPVLLGMLIRKFAENFIISKTKIIQKVSAILFLIVFIAIWVEEWDRIVEILSEAGSITLALNLIMMILAFYIAKFFATGVEQRRCITLEVGVQNGTLAVFVATQLFDEFIYLVPTGAYALIMYVTSLMLIYIIKKTT